MDPARKDATLYTPSHALKNSQANSQAHSQPNSQIQYKPQELSRTREGANAALAVPAHPAQWPLVVLLHAYPSTGTLENRYLGLSEWIDSKNFDL